MDSKPVYLYIMNIGHVSIVTEENYMSFDVLIVVKMLMLVF
jgi:hypothetical protein